MADTVLKIDEPAHAGYVLSQAWASSTPKQCMWENNANASGRSNMELKENTVIVVLGASGDLAKKKTFPALFGLVGPFHPLAALFTDRFQVPQQIPPQRYQDYRICSNQDGSSRVSETCQIIHKDTN